MKIALAILCGAAAGCTVAVLLNLLRRLCVPASFKRSMKDVERGEVMEFDPDKMESIRRLHSGHQTSARLPEHQDQERRMKTHNDSAVNASQVRPQASSVAPCSAWAALWRSKNKLDGIQRHIIYHNGLPALFKTRSKSRDFITEHYAYLKTRPDLQAEPHGWRMPVPVRVAITPNEPSSLTGPKTYDSRIQDRRAN